MAAEARTGAELLFPARATREREYRVPGAREVKPDWGEALPITRVRRDSPVAPPSSMSSYPSTRPGGRGQDTRSPDVPLPSGTTTRRAGWWGSERGQ